MASPEERLLTFCREVYSDHRERQARAQQIALGMLAFNGAFMAFLGAALWEVSHAQQAAHTCCPWLLAAGVLLLLAAAGVLLFVATRATATWPNVSLLFEQFQDRVDVAGPTVLARIYALATAADEPLVAAQYRLIATANIGTGLAFVAALGALVTMLLM